jgi:hypothetical protein
LSLNRLGGRDAAALVLGLASNTPLGSEVVEEIVERIGGVLLFVIGHLKALRVGAHSHLNGMTQMATKYNRYAATSIAVLVFFLCGSFRLRFPVVELRSGSAILRCGTMVVASISRAQNRVNSIAVAAVDMPCRVATDRTSGQLRPLSLR